MPAARPSAIDRVTVGLALVGGLLMLATAVLVTASVLLRWSTAQGIAGDFDLVQIALSLAIFAFLPLCQWRRSNIVVDSFTTRLPVAARHGLDAFWSAIYAAVAALVAWGMAESTLETIASGTTTMMLALPIGWAMGVATLFAAWLVVVAAALAQGLARTTGR